ncbi:type II toxin-antitoxin system HicA family toxin [Allocoleopsis sp.]|uniref:type II toxin-antitoxin system HicA family toxin n=1 Tax=Allocoleopsis sp. TaxID=3088169 RepID=UPI002FCE868F
MQVKVSVIEKVLKRIGFEKVKKKCAHARWKHSDGRATTVPNHGCNEVGGWLLTKILDDIGITEEEFNDLI